MFTTTVAFETATERGALDGYVMSCSCGIRVKMLTERMANAEASYHEEWHAKQDDASVKAPKIAKRHYCISAANDGYGSQFHTRRDGSPRSKTCTYCRGRLVVETGLHGVFVWTGDARYPAENAVKTFISPTAAEKYARAHAHDNLVGRWIPVSA